MNDASDSPRLISDIGGTNIRFALCDRAGTISEYRSMASADFDGPAAAAEAFLDAVKPDRRPELAAFAVAGPVTGRRIELTNRNWSFSVAEVRDRLGLRALRIVNDFVAVALALPFLTGNDREQVGGGKPVPGHPMAAIGPGTGLGVSSVVPVGGRWVPLPGEGGHTTIATDNDREAAIVEVIRRKHRHVSTEWGVSGPGLLNLYQAICTLDGVPPRPDAKPADVTKWARSGGEAQAAEALQTFCRLLGTAAGNLALTVGARGGVFIGGGIVPSMLEWFRQSDFRARFESKGRLSDYVREIPTYVITHGTVAMVGLAHAIDED